jgi:hypothetical protein
MNLSQQQMAELLLGIIRAQSAVIDAVDRAVPGFRGTHLSPALNAAATLRIADARLQDLPARLLIRAQGRNPLDLDTVAAALAATLSQAPATAVPSASFAKPAIVAATVAAPSAAIAASVAPAATAAPATATSFDENDFFNS